MAKNIIFCADGTWNTVDLTSEAPPEGATNVYKFFTLLQGSVIPSTIKKEDREVVEIEKAKTNSTGEVLQIAKYIDGVGNSDNKIKRLLGGGFGAGLVERIVRGFTFISRNYQLGDKIYIVGFSRGAYTARALAGMIASQGLLSNKFNRGSNDAYKLGTQAWYRYRKSVAGNDSLADFATAVVNRDVWNFLDDDLDDQEFIDAGIHAVAVWDTVGSMGVPRYDATTNELIDAFRFADNKLSHKTTLGLHAIALDEQRLLFTPTLWDKAPNVKQMVFPGGHSDVGGGYKEKGLSDAALEWFIQELLPLGVQFGSWESQVKPKSGVPAHQEWRDLTERTELVRKFQPNSAIFAHPSIEQRKLLPSVVHHRDERENKDFDIRPYRPSNWPPPPA